MKSAYAIEWIETGGLHHERGYIKKMDASCIYEIEDEFANQLLAIYYSPSTDDDAVIDHQVVTPLNEIQVDTRSFGEWHHIELLCSSLFICNYSIESLLVLCPVVVRLLCLNSSPVFP